MKIINKLTLRYLKENKKRTIFTILSIALSITMINAVGISLNSIMNYYRDTVIISNGSYHYRFITDNKDFFKMIEEDTQIKDYYYTNTNDYIDQKSQNYISLKKGDSTFYEKRNVKELLTEGELPTNSNEIVLSEQYLEDLDIGDKIRLKKVDGGNSQFEIVGFIDESKTTSYDRMFNALSYVDLNNGEYYTITIEDKELSNNIFTHAQNLQDKFYNKTDIQVNLSYNSSYLGSLGIFEEDSTSSFKIVYGLVSVILAIIVIASVVIIYQAFNLSMNDKIKYLGMLSSVGATPKQKRNSVFFEGIFLTLIALPVGFICSYIGMFVTFTYMNSLNVIKVTGAILQISFSLQYTLLTIILGILTVFISLIIPAIKLSRISVMNALKKDDEIKVKKSKLKVGFIQRKILRYNQQLALKNYKRQGKRSRVIVLSLVISMVLFITMYSFTSQMYKSIINNNTYGLYDISGMFAEDSPEINDYKKILDTNNKVESYFYYTKDYNLKAQLNQKYFAEKLADDGNGSACMSALDEQSFKKLCEQNNIEYIGEKQALVKGVSILTDGDNIAKTEYIKNPKDDLILKLEYMKYDGDQQYLVEAPLFESINYIEEDSYKLLDNGGYMLEIIVPLSYYTNFDDNTITGIEFCIKSDQHVELCEELKALGYSPYNQNEAYQDEIQTLLVVQIFVYGFICLMILFALLNIVNMMSASIDKRQKEFAMLLSVGLSSMGIKKMILYESLIYGLKTFLYGLPICILIEYIMYKMTNSNELFEVSYFAYIVSLIVVIIVMVLTFKVGLKKLNKQNIIEILKDDM